MGSDKDQRWNDLEIELHNLATLADKRRADEVSSFSPVSKSAALGGRECGVNGRGGTSAGGQPTSHSAEVEHLGGQSKTSLKRMKTAARPSSLKDSMSWPPVTSTLWSLLPLFPPPQLPSQRHQPQDSWDDHTTGDTILIHDIHDATSRDISDLGSQAPRSLKPTDRGQRLKRKCRHPSCHLRPSFGNVGQRAMYCAKHTLDGMVNVVARKCAEPGCKKGPSYGLPEDRKPVFCSAHRLPGHVNVVSPRCAHDGCPKAPSFGSSGTGNRPAYCAKHKLAGMVNVVSRSCKQEGCHSAPSFGFEGERATFCGKHRQDGQRNVISRR
eukprot:g11224.t1